MSPDANGAPDAGPAAGPSGLQESSTPAAALSPEGPGSGPVAPAEPAERLRLAERLREEGNAKFKLQDTQGARGDYEKALSLLRLSGSEGEAGDANAELAARARAARAPVLLNLALCCLRAAPCEANRALELCEEALDLEPDNPKAVYRKAKALIELDELKEAERELVRACRLSPKDASIRRDLEQLRQRERDSRAKEADWQTHKRNLDDLTMQIKRLAQPAEFRATESAQNGLGDLTAQIKRLTQPSTQPSESRATEDAESQRIMDWVKGKIEEPPQVPTRPADSSPPAPAAAGDAEMAQRIRQILADQNKPKPKPPPPPSAPPADSAATLEAVRQLLDTSTGNDAETLQRVRNMLDVQQKVEQQPTTHSDDTAEQLRKLGKDKKKEKKQIKEKRKETKESQRVMDFVQGALAREPEAKDADVGLGGALQEFADLQQTEEELERVRTALKFAEQRQAQIDRYCLGLELQQREGPLIEELDD